MHIQEYLNHVKKRLKDKRKNHRFKEKRSFFLKPSPVGRRNRHLSSSRGRPRSPRGIPHRRVGFPVPPLGAGSSLRRK